MSSRWARAARRPSCMSRSSPTCAGCTQGAGGVHHVAFRTPDARAMHAWAERLAESAAIERPGRPLLLPQPLFPRAERHPVRDRHGRPRLRRRRAAGTLGEKLALPPFLEPRRPRSRLASSRYRLAGGDRPSPIKPARTPRRETAGRRPPPRTRRRTALGDGGPDARLCRAGPRSAGGRTPPA